jgi:hypothetical protein
MVSIRKVGIDNLDVLLPLIKTTFFVAFEHLNNPEDFKTYTDKAFAQEQILSELQNPDSEYYFAVYEDEPAGFIKLNYGPAQSDVKDEKSLEVERIYVLQEHQSKKIGKLLMDFAEKRAKIKSLKYIWLGVWEHNHRAQNFYQRNGFEKFGSHEFVIGADVQTDFLMRKMIY